jgi:hypothetical protein
MGGKAKPTKHTKAELQRKADSHRADQGKEGGGQKGMAARMVPKSMFQCPICKLYMPSVVTMEQHYDSKHPKAAFNKSDFIKSDVVTTVKPDYSKFVDHAAGPKK